MPRTDRPASATQSRWQLDERAAWALVGLLTVLAAFLRLPDLGEQSLWYDEAATWSQVNGSLWHLISSTVSDNYPPLYNLLTWLLVQVFGDSEWVLRLPAALLGVATVPMVYLAGVRAGGRAAGVIAALFVTLSGFHIWYSHEARMYSLLAFTATAYAWAMLRDLENPSRRGGIMLAATGAALLFSHPYGALIWLSIAAGALLAPPRPAAGTPVRRLVRLHLITAAIFLPWGLALVVHAVEISLSGFWIPTPTPAFILEQLNILTGSLLLPLLALSVLAFVPAGRQPRIAAGAAPILVLWALGPLLAGVVASLLIEPVVIARYLIGSLPALFVLSACGIARWIAGPRSFVLAGALSTCLAIVSLVYPLPPPREDWRAVVAAVDRQLAPDDCVLVLPGYNRQAWSYYHRAPMDCLTGDRDAERLLQSPPGGAMFVIGDLHFQPRDEIVSRFGEVMDLRSTEAFRGLTLLTFDPRP